MCLLFYNFNMLIYYSYINLLLYLSFTSFMCNLQNLQISRHWCYYFQYGIIEFSGIQMSQFLIFIIFSHIYSPKFSVIPPSLVDVKKLMANPVFLGLPFEKMDLNESCIFRSVMPRCSDRFWKRIFMKIREDKVVSSSVQQYKPKNMARHSICSR